jgi:hypothetical protein
MDLLVLAQSAAALGALSGQQVALAGMPGHHFASRSDLEALRHGLLRLDTLRATHKNITFGTKTSAQYMGKALRIKG